MSRAQDNPVFCSEQPKGCGASVPGSKWDQVKAANEGWFFAKDGTAYCPAHVPDWVAGWRENRKRKMAAPSGAVEHLAGPMLRGAQLCGRCATVLWSPDSPQQDPPVMVPRWASGAPLFANDEGISVVAGNDDYEQCRPYWPGEGHRLRSMPVYTERALRTLCEASDDDLKAAMEAIGPAGRRRLRDFLVPPSRRSKGARAAAVQPPF